MPGAYYNENDPKPAAWLRELIKHGHIPAGEVDERSIAEVVPDDLRGFTQCHFFAGIGGWPLALRRAGWPDGRPVGTGSCPCPPFSAAGKKTRCPECNGKPIPHPYRTGIFACTVCAHQWLADGRHLWPEMLRLIAGSSLPTWFGEQVAGPDGIVWISGVRATLERIGFLFGAADLAAAGVGAPHIRQRNWWVAHSPGRQREQLARPQSDELSQRPADHGTDGRVALSQSGELQGTIGDTNAGRLGGSTDGSRVVDADHAGRGKRHKRKLPAGFGLAASHRTNSGRPGAAGGVGDAAKPGRKRRQSEFQQHASLPQSAAAADWSRFDLLPFRDGKTRRVESGTFPLAHGVSNRVGLLRGYGNAIVPAVAAEFIKAANELIQ